MKTFDKSCPLVSAESGMISLASYSRTSSYLLHLKRTSLTIRWLYRPCVLAFFRKWARRVGKVEWCGGNLGYQKLVRYTHALWRSFCMPYQLKVRTLVAVPNAARPFMVLFSE